MGMGSEGGGEDEGESESDRIAGGLGCFACCVHGAAMWNACRFKSWCVAVCVCAERQQGHSVWGTSHGRRRCQVRQQHRGGGLGQPRARLKPPPCLCTAPCCMCVCARARLLPLSCCLCGKLASPVVHTCAPNRAHAHARTHAGHAELVHDQRGAPPGRGIPPQQHHHKRAASPRCVAAGRECAQQVGSVPQQIVSARSQLRVRAAGRVCATASRKFAAASRGCAAARAAWRTAPAGSGAPV